MIMLGLTCLLHMSFHEVLPPRQLGVDHVRWKAVMEVIQASHSFTGSHRLTPVECSAPVNGKITHTFIE